MLITAGARICHRSAVLLVFSVEFDAVNKKYQKDQMPVVQSVQIKLYGNGGTGMEQCTAMVGMCLIVHFGRDVTSSIIIPVYEMLNWALTMPVFAGTLQGQPVRYGLLPVLAKRAGGRRQIMNIVAKVYSETRLILREYRVDDGASPCFIQVG